MGFEQEALRDLNWSAANSKSVLWNELDRSNRGEPFVLRQLLRHGTATPTQLAVALHASSGRVSALLKALEAKGLVSREIDEKDRRNILVSLTDAGRKQATNDQGKIDSAVCWIFSQMGERRTREFVNLAEEFIVYLTVCKPGEGRPDAAEVSQAFKDWEQRHEEWLEAGREEVRGPHADESEQAKG
ncbi:MULTISPECIES: MarR family transcriptional regulator [unclassified Bifidobacterium]|uniref:MarR family winged helix-turn-helix transcriptional regulator n=1 Tax=unclassified Bifidobacterium TaxID=2608897 RepID=UPI0023F938F7|nr:MULTISPECIES: MarR family transcriptional regulator [unclassified Bifidobacterium]WEV66643.1 MarR family transcriptional regulator [Bifidobacterium sp. ESL0764]WEV76544.1 MarR family transcriptional regulator [Bifidobacterium sp. ESL0800]